ncbi:hypothetical protein VTO42DRAFT_8912 [Malbranchea cinnamomea]
MANELAQHQDSGPKGSFDAEQPRQGAKAKSRIKNRESGQTVKRRCVSTACIACRKRKSKCDGNTPSCAACASVYHTLCVYDPNSDHRRKGVYKQDIANLKNRNSTLQTLIQAILNYDESDVPELIRQIRSCEDLEEVAESITRRENDWLRSSKPEAASQSNDSRNASTAVPQFEHELAGKMSEMRLEEGAVKYVGGTSNLIFLPPNPPDSVDIDSYPNINNVDGDASNDPITCWTTVTKSKELIRHLLTMYFTWHYAYFTVLSKELFYRDFVQGRSSQYCSPLLVNAMLALGCHFSSWPAAREDPNDSATAGDHFFKEAKRLILENDELEKAKLCTVQALSIMSVREAGCCREGSGWVYSGMSFRMAYDLGLNVDVTSLGSSSLSEKDIDARRITFWGCYLFDKCWSNYLGRQPQLAGSHITVPKFDIFPEEDAETWSPYTDSGVSSEHSQPSRTRAVALQISYLCEISSDLLSSFYHPTPLGKPLGKQEELRRLTHLHTRLEAWRKNLPKEFEPKDGQLPSVLLMHMFFQLLFIHLYRPFLKYTKETSPLPAHVSPRKLCTQAASIISKLLRMYKRSYGLRQLCNVAVYIVHSACTIHLLNLPDKGAKRDIVHGLKNLEEIAEGWLCARRTIQILDLSAQKWGIDLPDEAVAVFERCRVKFGTWRSPRPTQSTSTSSDSPPTTTAQAEASPSTYCSTPDSTPAAPYQDIPQGILATDLDSLTVQSSTSQPSSVAIPARGQLAQNAISAQPLSQQGASYINCNDETKMEEGVEPLYPYNNGIAAGTGQNSTFPAIPQLPALSGVEHLLFGSQDWWMKDQSALALGLDNWDGTWESPARDNGPSVSFDSAMPTTTASGVNCVNPSHTSQPNNQFSGGLGMSMEMPITQSGYGNDYIIAPSNPPTINLGQNMPHPPPSNGYGQGSGNGIFF